MTILTYPELLTQLRTIGLTRAQVGALMPAWWNPQASADRAGAWEFALMISRRLGLDAVALASGTISPLGDVSAPRFKHTARVSAEDLGAASRIAGALAKAIVAAMPERPVVETWSAAEVRAEILREEGSRVDFDALLEFAWRLGIPVIPLPKLPSGVKKMDAAALRIGDRPAIVIARKNDSKSWLSFILAHELGHILLGHVPKDGSIIEGSIQDTARFDAESQLDQQEMEANAFAHAVLGGAAADAAVARISERASTMQIVDAVIAAAPALRTAPGHLILRFAFLTQRWTDAMMALRFIADDVDAQRALIARLAGEIDTATLGDDLQDFVEQVTGIAARSA